MSKRQEYSWLALILILGAGLRFWGMDWGLPYEYQTEEHRIVKYALKMGGTKDFNPHMFIYPSLYLYFMLFMYGCYYLFGRAVGFFSNTQDFAHSFIRDPTCFLLIGRGLETVFSLFVVFVAYRLGKKIFSTKIGLSAALLLAVLPMEVYKSHSTKGDMAAILLGSIFLYFIYRIYETGAWKYYLYAGIALGLAFSTKYYMAIMTVALPIAHFLSPESKKYVKLCAALLLIPLFFIMGTPYSLIAPEFKEQLILVVGSAGASQGFFWERLTIFKYLKELYNFFPRFIRLFDFNYGFLVGATGIGILSMMGFGLMAYKHFRTFLILSSPILLYYFVVATTPYPVVGLLSPIQLILAISASYLFWHCMEQKLWLKIISFSIFTVSFISCVGESLSVAYSFSLKDTRTVAKEWIEKNIPPNKKILMDLLPYSPPLEMSLNQLEKFYQRALDTNHYKKEYFKLKLEVAEPGQIRYEIFVVQRTAEGLGVTKNLLEDVQKTQDLVRLNGDASDFKNFKKMGIEYVIANSLAKDHAKMHHPEIFTFYEMLPQKSKLLKTFSPPTRLHPGPEIKIYQLLK